MARPTKRGLSYFPLDVGFLRDKKVRLLRAEYGASSVLFVLYVLGKAYEGDGYFLRWDMDECLLASDELRESPTYISEVLQGCLSRSLFDEGVFQVFGILTSAGIQRRYLRGCEKRDDIKLANEYWLLNIDDKDDVPEGVREKLTFFEVSGGKNPVNSPGNPVNSPGNPESKVKESKVKKSKVDARASAFDSFWTVYPKRVGKEAARKAFAKIPKDALPLLLPAITAQRQSAQWQKEDGRFIPNPATWLNQGRWEDEASDIAPPEPPVPDDLDRARRILEKAKGK